MNRITALKPRTLTRVCGSSISVRHHSKQNIQKPRPPQFPRACVESVAQPLYPRTMLPKYLLCKKPEEDKYLFEPDHLQEIVLGKEIRKDIQKCNFLAVCHINALKPYDAYQVKKEFVKQNMGFARYPMVVLRNALQTTPYEGMLQFVIGNWMDCIIWSETIDVIPKFLSLEKKFADVVLLAAAVNNVVMSKSQLVEYNKLPAIEVLHGQTSAILNQFCGTVVRTLNHHQTDLVNSLTSYADDKKSTSSK